MRLRSTTQAAVPVFSLERSILTSINSPKRDLHAARAGTPVLSSQRGPLGTRCAAASPKGPRVGNQNNTEHGTPINLEAEPAFPRRYPIWNDYLKCGVEYTYGMAAGSRRKGKTLRTLRRVKVKAICRFQHPISASSDVES